MKWWASFLCLYALHANAAQQNTQDWLKTIAFAGHLTNFSGDFIYQTNNQIETFRISHVVANDGEYEKIQSLAGAKQEVIRHHGQTWCYRNHKMVEISTPQGQAKFPARMLDDLLGLNNAYQVKELGQARVAGHETRVILLQSKDNLRYSHQIWVHSDTGLLLKSTVLDEKNLAIAQYVFTQIKIGDEVERAWISAAQSDMPLLTSTAGNATLSSVETGWQVDNPPAGFNKSQEIKRPMVGKHQAVTQLIYTDGLSAISIFIEPADNHEGDQDGLTHHGVINMYQKVVGEQLFTVVGEVPARTVMQVLDSIRFHTQ
jgi:sigma-E factor negative regulatory protein RseB